jgi:hypothetical protein
VVGEEGQARQRLDEFLEKLRPVLPNFIRDDRRS